MNNKSIIDQRPRGDYAVAKKNFPDIDTTGIHTASLNQQLNQFQRIETQPALNLSCHHPHHLIFWIHPPPNLSGGFGDRLRGLVTTFYHALVANSSYSIDWTTPYSLSTYFNLHSCQTKMDVNNEVIRHGVDKSGYDYSKENPLYLEDLHENVRVTSNSLAWASVVRNPQFHDHVSQLGLGRYTTPQLFQVAIDSVLKSPEEIFRRAMNQRLDQIHHLPYLGVQLRIGGSHLWEDPERVSIESVSCFAEEAVRLCSLANLGAVFVTGDLQDAVDEFKEIFPLIWKNKTNNNIPAPVVFENFGTIAHTDRSSVSQDSDKVWLKSILDWWLLRGATALVISRSGFGETAAWSSHQLLTSTKSGTPLARTFLHSDRTCVFANTFYNGNDALFLGKDHYHILTHDFS